MSTAWVSQLQYSGMKLFYARQCGQPTLSCMRYAEALAEALCLFQTPSTSPLADSLLQHCLLFSLTEAHSMAIAWPVPMPAGAENQARFS